MLPMQYQGKDYRWEKNGDKVRFLINGKDGIEERKNSFYKYYALNEYSVDALTHLYIYDTHPCQLNDPLDCAEELIEFDDNETTRIMLGDMFPKVSNMYQNDETAINEFERVAFRTYYYMKMGIFSLTKNCDDMSMWSYYTNHEGFCVEYDINGFPYDYWGPFPINYQKELKSVSINQASLPLASLIQTNIKLDCWEHEQEWRLLIQCPEECYMEPFGFNADFIKANMHDLHDRKLKYPLRCIKSVCLGLKFFNGIYSIITDYEKEYVAINKKKNEVLSFLALSKIPTYIMDTDGLKAIRVPIEITKIRNNAYHIKC